jgi:predicted molibdopterin-dependent oxidoreductase YjgC
MTNDFDSVSHADVILVIGSNTTENHPVLGSWIKERKRKGEISLIVCDPRNIELTRYADVSIMHKSGSDVALLNGMMNVIIGEGLHDAEFVQKHVENFEALKKTVEAYTPEKVAAITGVDEETLRKAARLYAGGPNSALFYSMGITQHKYGTNNVRAVANTALLCGMIGRPGTGINPLRGQNNVQGACDTGCLPEVLPGYIKLASEREKAEARVREIWGSSLPKSAGKSIVTMMAGAAEGSLKGLYIMGENPMVSNPDTNNVRRALENLDFLVVQDLFLTETARLADVVLPAASWAEREGTFTNTSRAVQRIRKAVEAPGEARLVDPYRNRESLRSSLEFRFPGNGHGGNPPFRTPIRRHNLRKAGKPGPDVALPRRDAPGNAHPLLRGFPRGQGLLRSLRMA